MSIWRKASSDQAIAASRSANRTDPAIQNKGEPLWQESKTTTTKEKRRSLEIVDTNFEKNVGGHVQRRRTARRPEQSDRKTRRTGRNRRRTLPLRRTEGLRRQGPRRLWHQRPHRAGRSGPNGIEGRAVRQRPPQRRPTPRRRRRPRAAGRHPRRGRPRAGVGGTARRGQRERRNEGRRRPASISAPTAARRPTARSSICPRTARPSG